MMDQTDLYCQVTREKFSSQESLNREFGTKASSMLAFGAALLGAGAITLNFSDSKLTLSDPPVQAFIALIGTFLWTAASSLFVLLTWRWGNGPTVSSLAKALNHHQDREYAKLVGDEYMKSVNANWPVLDWKGIALKFGVVGLAFQAGSVAALGIFISLSPSP